MYFQYNDKYALEFLSNLAAPKRFNMQSYKYQMTKRLFDNIIYIFLIKISYLMRSDKTLRYKYVTGHAGCIFVHFVHYSVPLLIKLYIHIYIYQSMNSRYID